MPELVHPSQLDPRLADLQRPEHTGFTGGLCRALAQRWRVDPIIVRLAAVALTLAGGVGIALYAWGWLLTPRVGGQPPIMRWLPAFARWSRNVQALVVAGSSLVLVLSTARTSGVAWGPVIVVAVLAWAMARKRRNASVPSQGPFPPPSLVAGSQFAAPAAGESVEQWRARLGSHAGSPLPTVDLYAPEVATAPAEVAVPRQEGRTSWWAASGVLVVAVTAAVVPLALGLDPAIAWAGVAAGGAAALCLLIWSLVARSRRMPGAPLALALVVAVGSGLLAVGYSQATTTPMDTTTGGTASYSFVGEVDGQLDLTGLASDTAATVTIDATASVVIVRLATEPGRITVRSDTIHVERPSSRGAVAGGVDLVIDGDFSYVELQVAP